MRGCVRRTLAGRCVAITVGAILSLPGSARADLVRDNLRFTLYHELGHAVIDQLRVPMLGPEETAADGFALVLADRLHDEAEMWSLVTSVTAHARAQAVGAIDPWSPYMAEGQRIAWTICVWYGLGPALRGNRARALGLPPEAEYQCVADARRLRAGWIAILRRLEATGSKGGSLRSRGGGKALVLLRDDIARLREEVALPRETPVTQEPCGEDNAFYYQNEDRIVICDEMVEALQAAARR